MIAVLWCSPGIVFLIMYLVKWWNGDDITIGDLKTLGIMSTFGIFIPMLEKEIGTMEPGRVIIRGRKKEVANG